MTQLVPHYTWASDVAIGPLEEVVETRPTHPNDVLTDGTLSASDKRAILASWASDLSAVEGMPAYRELPGTGRVVSVDEILGALQALDTADLH